MKKSRNQKEFFFSPFFALRLPLLPLNNLFDFYEKSQFLEITDQIQKIINVEFKNPELLEALYLATPVLYYELIKFQNSPHNFNRNDTERLFYSLFKYFVRASSRCTPFGLFAGCVTGDISDSTKLEVKSGNDTIRHIRLDMDYLCDLAMHLSSIPEIRAQLNYFPNSSIYRLNKKIRYVEYRFNSSNIRSHHLVSIDSEEVINYVLKTSKNGMHYSLLIDSVLDSYDIPREEVTIFINSLIQNKILQSSLEPNVTGDEYFNTILRTLENIQSQNPIILGIIKILTDVEKEIKVIRNETSSIEGYKKVQQLLSQFETPVKEERLFQMDTVKKHVEISLSRLLVEQVEDTVKVISMFSRQSNIQSSPLEIFKRAFRERYENSVVKLTEVLDSEIGIGYKGSKSTADYYNSQIPVDDALNKFRIFKFKEFISSNNKMEYVSISDEDVEMFFGSREVKLPNSFNVMINLYNCETINPDNNLFEILTISPSPSSLLGRFCHADETLKKKVLELTSFEDDQYPNQILAEIVHLPQSRIGNILSRPHLRKYEIEYLAQSTLPQDKRIAIDDLYLYLKNDELILYSKRLKKRILPRLASAHNFSFDSLSTYHLLCDLQYQNYPGLQAWSWGDLSSEIFLPRVIYKSAVLFSARWIVNINDLFLKQNKDFTSFEIAFFEYKKKYHMPDNVIYAEGDNKLLLNISSPPGLNLLYIFLKKKKVITLFESFWNKNSPFCVKERRNENVYTNEIIIPFIKENNNDPIILSDKNIGSINLSRSIQRSFFPGSEWVYVKIYLREISFNSILLKLYPFVKKVQDNAIVKKWFFIRYADPKPHLRLRFLLSSNNMSSDFISSLHKALKSYIDDSKIYNITIDTYVREIERYGEYTMDQSESIFNLSSNLVCSLLEGHKNNVIENIDITALTLIDHTTELFYFEIEEKLVFYEKMFKSYGQEFNYDNNKQVKETFQNQYRLRAKEISFALEEEITTFFKPLKSNKKYLSEMESLTVEIKTILIMHKNDKLTKDDLLSSYIHMFMNRLMDKDQRSKEFFMYYCLFRFYKSKSFTQQTRIQNV